MAHVSGNAILIDFETSLTSSYASGQLTVRIARSELDSPQNLVLGFESILSDVDGNTIAEDAVFVDASGAAGKAQVGKNVAGFRLREFTMTDIRFVPLAADTGLIVYVMNETGTSHGKEFSLKVHVASVWSKKSGKWLCEFSQETAARQAGK